MHTTAIKKMELMKKISKLPSKKIDEINIYLQKIMSQIKSEKLESVSLEGIWKNKGFEKITDLEAEVKTIRNEINEPLLKKAL